MRSEKEMIDLILGVACRDARIRAVYMNGSRTNPNAPKDIFQDYDIVYVVTETASFLKNGNWISIFGDLSMLQEPDKNLLYVIHNYTFIGFTVYCSIGQENTVRIQN